MSRSMQSGQSSQPRNTRFSMSSILTLALWRLRKTWFLLFINMLGMIAAVIIICAIPLFSNVMTTAGLRSTLTASPTSPEIFMSVTTLGLSTPLEQTVHNQLDGLVRQNLGSLAPQTQFDIESTDFSFVKPPKPNSSLLAYGTTMSQAASHLGQLQGRIAHITDHPGTDIEVLLTPETAKQLGVTTGSTFKLKLNYTLQLPKNGGLPPPAHSLVLTAHVVGIFTLNTANSVYWLGENFQPTSFVTEDKDVYYYTILMSNDALAALFDPLRSAAHTGAVYTSSQFGGYTFMDYYHLDTSRISSSDLDTLINRMNNLQASLLSLPTDNGQYPYFFGPPQIIGPLFGSTDAPSILESFRSRVDVARIPVVLLTLQILALILFFISLITNLFVDSQAETIALLRSRGASRTQIFGALLAPGLALGLLAIVVGVPLAVITVILLAQRILPASQLNALNVITNNPAQAAQQIIEYAIAIVLIAMVSMSLTLFFVTRGNVLAFRRESARANKQPFWQRLNLDVIAGVIALVGYGFSLYLTSVDTALQGDAKTLIVAPLSVLAPLFLILGCILLFLRIFPLLLRFGAFLATRGRGAVSLLAMVQIARSPRQSIRMTMLLALAVAFALFTLVFTATQAQHISEVSTYLTGADFSGSIPTPENNSPPIVPAQELLQYSAIPGVLAASVGYTGTGEVGNINLRIQIRAVDPPTFANAVIWSSQKEYSSATSLLAQLQQERSRAITTNILPVIVDTNVLNLLQVHVGSTFIVREDTMAVHDLHCIIIGAVQHIPTVNDRIATGTAQDNRLLATGGILLDYSSYASAYTQQSKQDKTVISTTPQVNQVWLHTKDDPVSLASVRTALTGPDLYLNNLIDRRALLASLNNDPLYVVIAGVLAIGTVTALLLAFVGDLLASWISARTRLTNFAMLRALGATPRQVTNVLTWEQGVVYITGLLLGVIFGITFALTVIPSLTFTDLNTDVSSTAFYNLQSSLPAQVVLPPTLLLALLILALIFVLALTMMVRIVSQSVLSQTLRLNED